MSHVSVFFFSSTAHPNNYIRNTNEITWENMGKYTTGIHHELWYSYKNKTKHNKPVRMPY